MRTSFGSFGEAGILAPTVPMDISARTQRERVLTGLAQSCAEKTFSTATVADIVANASVSRATFYKHFENKRVAFAAAVELFAGQLEETASEAYASGTSPTDALHKATDAVLGYLATAPACARLLLLETPIVDFALLARHRDRLIGALETEWGTPEPARPDPRIAFGRAQVLMADYVTAGRTEQLPELLPELVYISLLPFLGQAEALEQAKRNR